MSRAVASDIKGQRLLVLGAGHQQVPLICRARERGAFVVTSDRSLDAPGRHCASTSVVADILDCDHNVRVARQYGVDGIVTIGTDQALVTVARVAQACALRCHVTPAAALRATHKAHMADALSAVGVRTPKRQMIGPKESMDRAKALRCPLVVKPADAQGQRGTARVETHSKLKEVLQFARNASRDGTVVVEEFLDGPEITTTAWVKEGRVHLIAVTDRVTYNPHPYLGIALLHVFPSFHGRHLFDCIADALTGVAEAYSMRDGPLYVQMIIEENKVAVVEAAARVGGGHETSLVPAVTGVDLIDCSINLALGLPVELSYDIREKEPKLHGLINFVLAAPGKLSRHEPMETLVKAGCVLEGGWYRHDGYEQGRVIDAYGRIGWFLVTAPDRRSLFHSARLAYQQLKVEGIDGRNLVFWPAAEFLRGL